MRILIATGLLLAGILWTATPASASGLTTSTSETGQVMVRNEGGVMYLSTETNGNGETVTTRVLEDGTVVTTTTSSRVRPLNNVIIQLPEGFARDFGNLLNGVLSFVMVIAALLVFFYLILGAFQWITSGGDKGKVDQARQKMTAAVVGLIIIAASFAILNLALNFLGFENLNDVFNSAGTIRGGAEVNSQAETELGEIIEATPSAVPDTN